MSHTHRSTVGFVLEQTLGHVTHAKNLRAIISDDDAVDAVWHPIAWEADGLAARLPGYGNWTVRAGLRARRAIRRMHRATPLDALFIHTQVPAVLATDWLRRIPTVVSVDATPLQYDELGVFYDHQRSHPVVERLKWHANRLCFERAAHLVSWSSWAKAGLVAGYGVPAEKVTVIPPGVDVAGWAAPQRDDAGPGPVRILFVGGDLERKGGWVLLDAVRRLRDAGRGADVELHLVTTADVPQGDGIVVHRGLTPNSAELMALYHEADVFCLPTRGDCLPMVLSEAGAAGLPLVSTGVGAIPEIVRDGETGFIVPQDDVDGLVHVLDGLVADPQLRRRLGANAAELVGRRYDAVKNARELIGVLVEAARHSPMAGPRGRRHARPGTALDGDEHAQPTNDVLLTVSGDVPPDVLDQVRVGARPRPDYTVMAETFGADLMDHTVARELTGTGGRLMGRVAGQNAVLAWACFRVRRRYRVVFTDGEQVGLPYAVLCRLAGRGGARHIMIVHIMSVAKKALLFRACRLRTMIDVMVVYATAQRRYLQHELHVPADQILLRPFMVDTAFFNPDAVPPSASRPTICSAGLEFRDYPTMIEAVRGLDVHVVLAAASPWSKRGDTTRGEDIPDNVEVRRFGFVDLRQLYADSMFVVMPLQDVPFQAGVTTILEAMAMGRAVICSRTTGQTDVVVDGETGLYVTPGDAAELRAAITTLLDDPALARRMGAAGRRRAEAHMDVVTYARDLDAVVHPRRRDRQDPRSDVSARR